MILLQLLDDVLFLRLEVASILVDLIEQLFVAEGLDVQLLLRLQVTSLFHDDCSNQVGLDLVNFFLGALKCDLLS